MDKRNKALIILGALVLVFTIIGGTLAYFQWTSNTAQNTAVTFTVQSGFSCSADGGGSITSNDKVLAPSSCTNTTYAIKRTITVKPTITQPNKTIYMDLYLQVNQIGTYLAQSQYFRYALTTDSTSCTSGVIASGSFQGTSTNSKVRLLHNKSYSSTTNDPYYLYVWLDKDETDNNTQNQPFDISLTGTCTDEAPTTFTGTIYRYSDTTVSIGQRIALQQKQAWCANSVEEGNSCDFGWFWDTEQECENFVSNNNMENTTCGEGTVQPISYETNASNLNKTFYLKHTIVDDIVTESYVEFVVTSEMAGANSGMTAGTYYLKGGDNGAAYTTNKATLTTAFGSSNCTDTSSYFDCNVSGLNADADAIGNVFANDGASADCSVGDDGGSHCNE